MSEQVIRGEAEPETALPSRSDCESDVMSTEGHVVAGAARDEPAPVEPTWLELRGVWRAFTMSEWLMRDRASFFGEIKARHALGPKLVSMALSSAIYLALYGLVMGISNSWMQAAMSAIKLPMLYLETLIICLPTLYFFNLLYGSQLTFSQTAALMMAAITITGALALAFASITLFLWMTIGDQYTILALVNVVVLGTSSWWGVVYLRQGMRFVQEGVRHVRRRSILLVWLVIYAFVGTQMGWSLRPFFGAPGEPFVVLRGGGGTFVGTMLTAIGWLIGGAL